MHLQHVITATEERSIRWAEHVACTVDMSKAYVWRVAVGKTASLSEDLGLEETRNFA
jgi:hypothetical protein